MLDARIVSRGIPERTLEAVDVGMRKINKPYSLTVIPVADTALPRTEMTNPRLDSAVYLRLLIPRLCADLSKVLYLDCDTIVRHDVSGLFIDQSDRYSTLAVIDKFETLRRSEPEAKKLASPPLVMALNRSVDLHAPYFNSGVMLMNLDIWRKERIADKAMSIACLDDLHLRYEDQSTLNIVLNGQWGRLDDR